MFKTILFAIAAMSAATSAFSQSNDEKYPKGLRRDDPETWSAFPTAQLTRAYIPEAIDLSPSFPPPQQQKHSSCVAWATGYAARSYYARFETAENKHLAANIPSPAYIYNMTYDSHLPDGCKGGTTFTRALKLLMTKGAFSLADYGVDRTCVPGHPLDSVQPSRFRIKTAAVLGGALMKHQLNLDVMRQMLATGHPVLIGFATDTAFTELRPDQIYAGAARTTQQLKDMAGHAMALVGYDDRRRAFRVINSWGTTWGDGGFGWIGYDAILHQTTDAFIMQTEPPPPKPAPSRPVIAENASDVFRVPLEDPHCADIQISSASLGKTDATGATLTARYTGFVSTLADKKRFDDIAEAKGHPKEVQLRPWPVCEAMMHLRAPLRAESRPSIQIADGRSTLKVGDTFALKIKAPDIPSFIYAFYLEDDGTVVNLLPRRGAIRAMTGAKAEITLGDGQSGRATYRVTPLKRSSTRADDVRGYEAVVVLAARAPIKELEDLEAPGNLLYRVAAKADHAAGPPDRLLMSQLRDIAQRREKPDLANTVELLQREVGADVLQIKIVE